MKRSVLVITGASGVGKTTVASSILKAPSDFGLVRSITTRAPRGDGHDGEYLYATREEFFKKAESGELVEHTDFGDNLYGTPKSELDRIFSEGKTPLLVLDIEGIKSLRAKEFDFNTIIVYVWYELDLIEKRLYERDLKEPTAEKLLSFLKRKANNIRDFLAMPELCDKIDLFVKNERVEDSVKEILSAFEKFSRGEARADLAENKKIANRLYEMAKAKE